MNYLSLFSGIGGLDLGLDRAGMTCAGQVELDAWCRAVLDHHWPEVPKHDDVRTTPEWWKREPRPAVRLVAGGFPCQPFSPAGRRRGVGDPRWGWPWFRAVVRAVQPEYVLVENVPALLRDADAFGWLLGDLAEDGFDADWTVLSACAMGAPHVRERLFVLAYANGMAGAPAEPCPVLSGTSASRGIEGTDGRRRAAGDHWAAEPDVGRVAHGVPARMDRLRGLGNAVVPQVAEHIGRLILDHAKGAA